jgi:hypothetical protein
MEISKQLRISRPNLSELSIKTYTSLLSTIYKNVFNKNKINMSDFNNVDKILNHLKNIKPVTRKTILSALYVLTKNDDYKINMLEDIKENDIIQEKQEKTQTQKENWLENDKLQSTLKELKNKAYQAYKSIKMHQEPNKHYNVDYYKTIQNYLLVLILSGEMIPPRRAKDYTEFKIKNITNKDNYLKGDKIYFNTYKGSEAKGQQIIEIPLKLKIILTKWIKINPTDYLFFDGNFNKLSNVTLNQRLNKIFD